jgi:predicted nucleic acid-binding protein
MLQHEVYSPPQIEPGSLKNFAAQLKEGAAAARQLRPQCFVLLVVQSLPSALEILWLSSESTARNPLTEEEQVVSAGHDGATGYSQGISKDELNLVEVPMTGEVACELRFTILGYRDPVDRFLVATAKVYDLTLVTADERLMRVPGIRVLANR